MRIFAIIVGDVFRLTDSLAAKQEYGMIGECDIEAALLEELIRRAEVTLAAHRALGGISRDTLWLFEGFIARMYEERRTSLEEMMRNPFFPGKGLTDR